MGNPHDTWSTRSTGSEKACWARVAVQLTLEQHGLKLIGSTYTQIFFSIVNIIVLHNLVLVESSGIADTEEIGI